MKEKRKYERDHKWTREKRIYVWPKDKKSYSLPVEQGSLELASLFSTQKERLVSEVGSWSNELSNDRYSCFLIFPFLSFLHWDRPLQLLWCVWSREIKPKRLFQYKILCFYYSHSTVWCHPDWQWLWKGNKMFAWHKGKNESLHHLSQNKKTQRKRWRMMLIRNDLFHLISLSLLPFMTRRYFIPRLIPVVSHNVCQSPSLSSSLRQQKEKKSGMSCLLSISVPAPEGKSRQRGSKGDATTTPFFLKKSKRTQND
jgi:hypothetical protein